jgi:hypothetical protein
VFRFAIELATRRPDAGGPRDRLATRVVPNSDKTLASLAELFLPRPECGGRRPTQLIYRAWHLFEVDPLILREMSLTAEQGCTLLLPGAEQIMGYYRRSAEQSAIIQELKRVGFVHCPSSPADDRKPFLMGSPEGHGQADEHPQHLVTLEPFQIQAAPVTRAQYLEFDREWERTRTEGIDRYSTRHHSHVTEVSWYDSFAFAKSLGRNYRLPTEAEWEYGCREGSMPGYSCACPASSVLPPHLKDWGPSDKGGNVWEWCWDWYGAYRSDAVSNPVPDSGSLRVYRGGTWLCSPGHCRLARRNRIVPDAWNYALGFRVSRVEQDV